MIRRSWASDLEFMRARAALRVESPSHMTLQRGESGLLGDRVGIADQSGIGVADTITTILAPEFANTTHSDSKTRRGNPSLCLLSPRPPWDSATRLTPCSQGDSERLQLSATPIPDRLAIPIRSPKRLDSLRCEVMRLGDSTHDAALARTTDSNSKSVARDRPIDSAPQGVLTWRLRGTLPVIGKTRSRCDQSTLEIATSPSGLDAPDRRDFPKIRIDAVRRRECPL